MTKPKTRKDIYELLESYPPVLLRGVTERNNYLASEKKKYLSNYREGHRTYEELNQELTILETYERSFRDNMMVLNDAIIHSKPKAVEVFFIEFTKSTETCLRDLEKNRSNTDVVWDFVKNVANFCIKLLTYLTPVYTPQHFNTTTKPVETVKRDVEAIKSQLQKLYEEFPTAKYEDDNSGEADDRFQQDSFELK